MQNIFLRVILILFVFPFYVFGVHDPVYVFGVHDRDLNQIMKFVKDGNLFALCEMKESELHPNFDRESANRNPFMEEIEHLLACKNHISFNDICSEGCGDKAEVRNNIIRFLRSWQKEEREYWRKKIKEENPIVFYSTEAHEHIVLREFEKAANIIYRYRELEKMVCEDREISLFDFSTRSIVAQTIFKQDCRKLEKFRYSSRNSQPVVFPLLENYFLPKVNLQKPAFISNQLPLEKVDNYAIDNAFETETSQAITFQSFAEESRPTTSFINSFSDDNIDPHDIRSFLSEFRNGSEPYNNEQQEVYNSAPIINEQPKISKSAPIIIDLTRDATPIVSLEKPLDKLASKKRVLQEQERQIQAKKTRRDCVHFFQNILDNQLPLPLNNDTTPLQSNGYFNSLSYFRSTE